MDEITLKAMAKINLGLDVTGCREDGYHEVRMVMQTVNLYDELKIQKTKEPGIRLRTNLRFLPTDGSNLICRAAMLMTDRFGLGEGLEVDLKKRIPVAAGMAGGSTDAAAMLYGINRLFDLGLTKGELMEYGLKLGADVPYCIMRGTALAEGIGEKLTRIAPMVKCPVLIAKPGIPVSTKQVYQELILGPDTEHPDIDGLIREIKAGSLEGICGKMGNLLERVTIPTRPVIAEIKQKMKEAGALGAMMSGSGPTVFGLFGDMDTARRAKELLQESGLAKQIYVTGIYNVPALGTQTKVPKSAES